MTTSIVAVAEPNAVPPRVRLTITTDRSLLTVYRTINGERVPVRSSDGTAFITMSSTFVAFDSDIPLGLSATYTSDDPAGGSSAGVTVNSASVWAVHPYQPALSRAVKVVRIDERSRESDMTVRYPLAAKYPIVTYSGQRRAATYEVQLRTRTLAELADLEALTEDQAPLLLNIPADRGWGQDAEWVQVGTWRAGRVVRFGPQPFREWTWPCTVVRRPVGPVRPAVTYGDSFSRYPTYGERFTAHATYGPANDPANY